MADEEIPEALLEPAQFLQTLTGEPVRPYMTYDFGRARDESAVSVILPEEDAFGRVYELQREVPDGHVGFVGTTKWLGDEDHDGVEVVVGPGNSQLDIIRLARTDAVNYGMDTGDIVDQLTLWNDDFGIRIIQAETDTVRFEFEEFPDDLEAFAEELYEFCPDIVDQGVGSVDGLVDVLDTTGGVVLWWD